jgi:hypothetical protein
MDTPNSRGRQSGDRQEADRQERQEQYTHTPNSTCRQSENRQEAGRQVGRRGRKGRGRTCIHPAVGAEVRRQQLRVRNEVLNAVKYRV